MLFYLDAGNAVKPELIAGVVASVSLLLIFLVAMLVWFVAKKRFNQGMPNAPDWTSVNPNYFPTSADGKILKVFLFGIDGHVWYFPYVYLSLNKARSEDLLFLGLVSWLGKMQNQLLLINFARAAVQ